MPSLNLLSEPKSTTSAGKAIPRSNNSFSKKVFPQTQGRINHGAKRAMAQGPPP